jgi:hypothetical protein
MATIIANNLEVFFPEATVLLKPKTVHEWSLDHPLKNQEGRHHWR